MNETKLAKIEFRQDTRENWESANPVLGIGEPGYDITQKMFKIGDGTSTWNALSYQTNNDTVIPEVPDDGKLYGRIRYPNNQSGSWSEVNIKGVEEAPLDGKYYSRQNGEWKADPTNAKKFDIIEQRNIQINDNANIFTISQIITKPLEKSYLVLSDSTKADILKLSLDVGGRLTLSTADDAVSYVIYNGTAFVGANFTTTSEGSTITVQFNAEKRTITITKALTITSIDNLDIADIVFIEVPKEMDLVDVYDKIQTIDETNSTKHWKHYTYTFDSFEEMYNTLVKVYANNPLAKIGLNATAGVVDSVANTMLITTSGISMATTEITLFSDEGNYYYVSLASIAKDNYIMTYYGLDASTYSVAFAQDNIGITGTRVRTINYGVEITKPAYYIREVDELKTIIFDIYTTPESIE